MLEAAAAAEQGSPWLVVVKTPVAAVAVQYTIQDHFVKHCSLGVVAAILDRSSQQSVDKFCIVMFYRAHKRVIKLLKKS